MESGAETSGRPGLTLPERIATLLLAILVFVFGAGPLWRHPWSPDASILWSYAVIPAVVLVFLTRRRVLRAGTLLSESLVLAVFKFGITAMVLIGFWSFSKPPAARASERRLDRDRAPRTVSRETKDSATPRQEPTLFVAVGIGGGRIVPAAISLAQSSAVEVRSSDGRLHALEILAPDGSVRANVPLLGSGAPRTLSFEDVSGDASLRCAIHPEETATLSR